VRTRIDEGASTATGAGGDGAGDGTSPASAQAQQKIERAYRASGLNWPKPPFYDPRVPEGDYALTGSDEGVQVGNTGVVASDAMLTSALIAEDVHVQQILTGNYAIGGTIGGIVNEMETEYRQLDTANTVGLSEEEYNEINVNLWKNFQKLADAGTVGYDYRMQILVYGDFTLRPQDVSHAPLPAWLRK